MSKGAIKDNTAYRKVLAMLWTFLLLFAVLEAQSAEAESNMYIPNTSQNIKLLCDNCGVYAIGYSGNSLSAHYIDYSGTADYSIKVDGQIKSTAVNNGNIYALSSDDDTIIISKYIYSADTLYMYRFDNIKIGLEYKFYVSNDRVYFAYKNNRVTTFYCYTITGNEIYSFSVDDVTDFTLNQSGSSLYIVSQNEIYTVDTGTNDYPKLLTATVPMRADVYTCNDVLFDSLGNVNDLQNHKAIQTGCSHNNLNGGVINGYYCKYSDGKILGYNEQGREYILYNTRLNENAQMCSYNNSLYVLSKSGKLLVINSNELAFSDQGQDAPAISPATEKDDNTPTQQPSVDSKPHKDSKFSINSYKTDSEHNMIYGIKSGTTIAQLKNNLTYTGYSVEFYNKNNVKIEQGKVGTNFTMVVTCKGSEYARYILSVQGDLTGEGSVNRSDAKLLSRYLMNGESLNTAQVSSAECSGDGKINGVDVLKIAKNNL